MLIAKSLVLVASIGWQHESCLGSSRSLGYMLVQCRMVYVH